MVSRKLISKGILSLFYHRMIFFIDSKFFPFVNGWLVHLDNCDTATCGIRLKRQTEEECKERCLRKSSCLMIKYRPSKKRCWLCSSINLRFRTVVKDGTCRRGTTHNFYIKDNTWFVLLVSK